MKLNSLLLLFVVSLLAVGSYAIFFYWNIGEDNKWGTFFSFLSASGIIFILIDYLNKKNTEKNNKNNILILIYERYNRQYTDSSNAVEDFIDEVCKFYYVHGGFIYHEQIDRNGLILLIKERLINSSEMKIAPPLLASPGFTNSDILQLATYNKNMTSTLLDTEQCIDDIKNEIRWLLNLTSKDNIKSTPPICVMSSVIKIERLHDALEEKISSILQKP
ncbi:TPA: hypothetical protein ACW0T4_000002 [Morganella morganii]